MKIAPEFVQASLTSFSYFATCKNVLLQVFNNAQNSEFQRIWMEQQQLVWNKQGWDDSILHMQYMLNEGSIYCMVMDDCFGTSSCFDQMLSISDREEESVSEKDNLTLKKIQLFVSQASQERRIEMYDLIYISWIAKWISHEESSSFVLCNVLHLFNNIFHMPWVSFNDKHTSVTKYSHVIKEVIYTECAYINDLCFLFRYKCKLAQLLHRGILQNLFINVEALIAHHSDFAFAMESTMMIHHKDDRSKETAIFYLLNEFATKKLLNLYFVWSTEYMKALHYFQQFPNQSDHPNQAASSSSKEPSFPVLDRRSSQEPSSASPSHSRSLRRGNSYKLRRFMSVRQDDTSMSRDQFQIKRIYNVDNFFTSEKAVEMILIKPVQRICKYELFFSSDRWKNLLQNLNRQINFSGQAILDFQVFQQTIQKWKGLDLSQLGVVRYRSKNSTQVVVVNSQKGVSTRNIWIYIFTNGLVFFEKHEEETPVVEIKGYLKFKNINGLPNVNQETKTIILSTNLSFMQSFTIFFQDDTDFAEILICLITAQN